MILNRLGKKRAIAALILKHLPDNILCWIEPFFGAGGFFFAMPTKAKHNIINDLDKDVFNLYMVIRNNKEEFTQKFEECIYSEALLSYWKKNLENDPVMQAVRFVYISNFTLYGSPTGSLKINVNLNVKKIALDYIEPTYDVLKNDVIICNRDFRDFLKSISFRKHRPMEKKTSFIYCDPPYLNTGNNYKNSFTEKDFTDLLDILVNLKVRFAVSEFDNEFCISEARKRGLNIITIGERKNIQNRRTEILITNYEKGNLFNQN